MSEAEIHRAPLTAEFEFTPAEVREAVRALTKRSMGFRTSRGLFGWILFIALAILLFFLLKQPNAAVTPAPTPAQPPPPASLMTDFVLPLVPWLLIFGFVWFFVFKLIRAGRMRKDNPLLNRTWNILADEQGLKMWERHERIEWTWEAFTEFGQSRNLYLLHKSKAYAVPIPKRVFSDPAAGDAFRNLAERHISPRIFAFPVLPARS